VIYQSARRGLVWTGSWSRTGKLFAGLWGVKAGEGLACGEKNQVKAKLRVNIFFFHIPSIGEEVCRAEANQLAKSGLAPPGGAALPSRQSVNPRSVALSITSPHLSHLPQLGPRQKAIVIKVIRLQNRVLPCPLYLGICTRYESATMKRITVDNASQPSSEDAGAQSKTVSLSTSSGTPQSPGEQRQRNVLPPEIMEILVPSTQIGAVTGVLLSLPRYALVPSY